jgi:hypothetical protein
VLPPELDARLDHARQIFDFFEAVQYDPARFIDPLKRFDALSAVSRANTAWRDHMLRSILGLNSAEIEEARNAYFQSKTVLSLGERTLDEE